MRRRRREGGGRGASAKPAALKITATGNAKAPTFAAPAKVAARVVDITLANNTKGDTDATLVGIDGQHSDAEVLAELKKAISSQAVADWFHGGGGMGARSRGRPGR